MFWGVFQLCSSCASNSDRRLKKCFAAILETILLFPANLPPQASGKRNVCLSFIIFYSLHLDYSACGIIAPYFDCRLALENRD